MSNPKTITELRKEYTAAQKEWREAIQARRNAPFGHEWNRAHQRVIDAMLAVVSTKSALYAAIAEKD